MKRLSQITLLFALGSSLSIVVAETDDQKKPGTALAKVETLLVNLQGKIDNETKRETEMHVKYMDYCNEVEANASAALKAAQLIYDDAQARIKVKLGEISDVQDEIDKLTRRLTRKQRDYDEALEIRAQEKKDFDADSETLATAIANLGEAKRIIEEEMAKHPEKGIVGAPSALQVDKKRWAQVLKTLSLITEASALPSFSRVKLASLIQEEPTGDELERGNIKVYKTQSGGIYEQLEEMEEDAQSQLYALQHEEQTSIEHFTNLRIQLEFQIKSFGEDLNATQAEKDRLLELLGQAQKESLVAEADIAHNTNLLRELKRDCDAWQLSYEQFMKDQAEEISVLKKAEVAVAEAMGHVKEGVVITPVPDQGPVGVLLETSDSEKNSDNAALGCEATKYGCCNDGITTADRSGSNCLSAVSFLQVTDPESQLQKKVIDILKKLGRKGHSTGMMQLASRVRTMFKLGHGKNYEFEKVKKLIQDYMLKLRAERDAVKKEGAWCDEQLLWHKKKLEELEVVIADLDSEIKMSYSREMDLTDKKKKTELEKAAMVKANQELNELFGEQTRIHVLTVKELEAALSAVRLGKKYLKDFYGFRSTDFVQVSAKSKQPLAFLQKYEEVEPPDFLQDDSEEASAKPKTTTGKFIIDMLEMVEADLARGLSKEDVQYTEYEEYYQKQEKGFRITFEGAEKDVIYYGSEYLSAERYTAQVSADEREKRDQQKKYITTYIVLKERCTAVGGQYAEKKAKREEEIMGLRKALDILTEESIEMVQLNHRVRRSLRGLQEIEP